MALECKPCAHGKAIWIKHVILPTQLCSCACAGMLAWGYTDLLQIAGFLLATVLAGSTASQTLPITGPSPPTDTATANCTSSAQGWIGQSATAGDTIGGMA